MNKSNVNNNIKKLVSKLFIVLNPLNVKQCVKLE